MWELSHWKRHKPMDIEQEHELRLSAACQHSSTRAAFISPDTRHFRFLFMECVAHLVCAIAEILTTQTVLIRLRLDAISKLKTHVQPMVDRSHGESKSTKKFKWKMCRQIFVIEVYDVRVVDADAVATVVTSDGRTLSWITIVRKKNVWRNRSAVALQLAAVAAAAERMCGFAFGWQYRSVAQHDQWRDSDKSIRINLCQIRRYHVSPPLLFGTSKIQFHMQRCVSRAERDSERNRKREREILTVSRCSGASSTISISIVFVVVVHATYAWLRLCAACETIFTTTNWIENFQTWRQI